MAEISTGSIIIASKEHLRSLDLETATFVVQSTRAKLMQEQLKGQVNEVQQANARIDKINAALTASRELTARFADKDENSKKIADLIKKDTEDFKKTDVWKSRDKDVKDKHKAKQNAQIKEQKDQIVAVEKNPKNSKEFKERRVKEIKERIKELEKEKPPETPFDATTETESGKALAKLKAALKHANISLNPEKKSDLTVAIENFNTKIDSLNSSQQMNMARMQSLSSKSNESYELITNFIKKFRDSLTSMIANLR